VKQFFAIFILLIFFSSDGFCLFSFLKEFKLKLEMFNKRITKMEGNTVDIKDFKALSDNVIGYRGANTELKNSVQKITKKVEVDMALIKKLNIDVGKLMDVKIDLKAFSDMKNQVELNAKGIVGIDQTIKSTAGRDSIINDPNLMKWIFGLVIGAGTFILIIIIGFVKYVLGLKTNIKSEKLSKEFWAKQTAMKVGDNDKFSMLVALKNEIKRRKLGV